MASKKKNHVQQKLQDSAQVIERKLRPVYGKGRKKETRTTCVAKLDMISFVIRLQQLHKDNVLLLLVFSSFLILFLFIISLLYTIYLPIDLQCLLFLDSFAIISL